MNKSQLTLLRLCALLGFAGVIACIYLTVLHFQPTAASFCNVSETINCSKVTQSEYSEIYGIPVAILGLMYYLFVTIFGLFADKVAHLKSIDIKDLLRATFIVTTIGFGFSLFLTYQEAFVLHAYCLFCVTQQILIACIWFCLFKLYKSQLSGS